MTHPSKHVPQTILWKWFRIMFAMILLIGSSLSVAAAQQPDTPQKQHTPNGAYIEGQILVRFQPSNRSPQERAALHQRMGTRAIKTYDGFVDGLELVQLPAHMSVEDAVKRFEQERSILYAEPDYVVRIEQEPDDTSYANGDMWNLNSEHGLDMPAAWNITTGSRDVVVAVVDQGIDYKHEDLAANIWRNTAECNGTEGVDDDNNGYVDDCHGYDTIQMDGDPIPETTYEAHGTHIAGIIGATGNNAKGVTGVNQNVSLLSCRALAHDGSGSNSSTIACDEYIAKLKTEHGVNIVATNNSYGGYDPPRQAEIDAVQKLMDAGILFVGSAGNSGTNNDFRVRSRPVLANVINVAAIDKDGRLGTFSNFGRGTVDIAAPGVKILSTYTTGNAGGNYQSKNGTSMASPHAAGVAALLKAQNNDLTWWQIRNLILASGDDDLPDLQEKTITGKHLNAHKALTCKNQRMLGVMKPAGAERTQMFPIDEVIELQAININCAEPAGNVVVTVTPGNTQVTLADDGGQYDDVAGDGVYGGAFTPENPGFYTFTFSNGNEKQTKTVKFVRSVYYGASVTKYEWRDLSDDAKRLGLDYWNNKTADVAAPFSFTIGNKQIQAGEMLTVDHTGQVFMRNGTIVLKPFQDTHLEARNTSTQDVFWETQGTAPNRTLLIEWRGLDRWNNCRNSGVTFQIVLFEGKSDILYNYKDVTLEQDSHCKQRESGGAKATISVQNGVGNETMVSKNQRIITDESALLFRITGADEDEMSDMLPAGPQAYGVASTQYAYRDLLLGGTPVVTAEDKDMTEINLSFPFKLLDTEYMRLYINKNGYISSKPTTPEFVYANRTLPFEDGLLIAPFWDDLQTEKVYWGIVGKPPNRELVLEWREVASTHCEGTVTFQVALAEMGSITFNYKDVTLENCKEDDNRLNGGSATVGLQLAEGRAFLVGYNQAFLKDGSALLFSPPMPPSSIKPLTVSKTGYGNGTITSDVDGIDCGTSCSANFDKDAIVTLTAMPNSDDGSSFVGWGGACTDAGTKTTCKLTLANALFASARFEQEQTMSVTKDGDGSGTVTSKVASDDAQQGQNNIACGETCAATYYNGTAVQLVAVPDGNSLFLGWSGACSGNGPCHIEMAGDTSVTANFLSKANVTPVCKTYTSTDVNREIPDNGRAFVDSLLKIPDDHDGAVTSVKVVGLTGTHDWVNDVVASLMSPQGTEVTLLENICQSEDNFNLSFDDASSNAYDAISCPPTDGATYQPKQFLATFGGERSKGPWRLLVRDSRMDGTNGNTLTGWALEICTIPYDFAEAPEVAVPQVCLDAVANASPSTRQLLPRVYSPGMTGPSGASDKVVQTNIQRELLIRQRAEKQANLAQEAEAAQQERATRVEHVSDGDATRQYTTPEQQRAKNRALILNQQQHHQEQE